MPVALCTFTPNGGGTPISLGSEDCWIEVRKEVGRTVYTVTAYYVNRQGNRFFLEGSTRASAEVYARDLADTLSARPLVSLEGPDGTMYVPDAVSEQGTLTNPYTDLSADNCFCTSVAHADEGSRRYGIIFTFEQPDFDASDVPADNLLEYKGTPLGNLPSYVVAIPSVSFIEYTATFFYRGEDAADYPHTLSNAIGLLPITRQTIVRASLGSLGEIKTWNAETGTLSHEKHSFESEELYVESITNNREGDGLLSMTAVFVKGR